MSYLLVYTVISLIVRIFAIDISLMYLDLVVVAAVLFGIVSRVTVQQDV